MDKYFAFRKMMDFLADYAEVVDANLNTWSGGFMLKGENDEETITFEVTIEKKEAKENA